MSKSTNKGDAFDQIFMLLFQGIYLFFYSFFLGFYELRKKAAAIVFVISVLISVVMLASYRWFGLGSKIYVLASAALPVVVLMVLGGRRKQRQSYFKKSFADANFRGKDKHTPLLLDLSEKDGKTKAYFKSNITLSQWENNKELLQTSLDVQINTIEQGKSKKIICMEYVPSNFDLPKKVIWKPEYLTDPETALSEIVLGVSRYGQLKFDFNDIAHWIIAGAPGVGKSVLVRLISYQCFLKGFKVYIMDFKRGMEFGTIYDQFCEVVMDKKRASEVLEELYKKCLRNADILREKGFKNIDDYNRAYPNDLMERYVLILDEVAALILSGKDKEDKEYTASCTYYLEQIAILGRAPGVNLVLGIQRPDMNTISGQIKSNVLGRICGFFVDAAPSMIVLNNTMANELPPPSKIKGRYMIQYGQDTFPFQGYLLDDFKAMKELLKKRSKTQHPDTPVEAKARSAKSPPLKPVGVADRKGKKPRANTDLITDYDNLEDFT